MKVAKFGGSSVASAEMFRKIAYVLQSDEERKFIVVSAPGKRNKDDIKITDLLISLTSAVLAKENYNPILQQIVQRYREIAEGLNLSLSIIEDIQVSLEASINKYKGSPERLLDALKASGEDNNAKLMAFYLTSIGLKATYVRPDQAGIFVTDEPGNAQILPESYEKIYQLRQMKGIIVIPGFFGFSLTGNVVTFPRGGSDITGSIIAAGVNASIYENFTDVDSIYSVNPNLVDHPAELRELTYREMRELSYSGFSVFHDEALQPVYRKKIPVNVKNTNNPHAKGTFILATRDHKASPVAGIAGDKGFCSINVSKYLMNREIGFGRRLLEILEDENISFEHTPSGIDNMSVILRADQLCGEKEERVLSRIQQELEVDDIHIDHNLALVMVVGEGMADSVGIAAKATMALAAAKVNLELINQGASEVSMMFGVKKEMMDQAITALYHAYFSKKPMAATLS